MEICDEARAALAIAATNEAPIADLELVGLGLNIINQLEKDNIRTIGDLLQCSRDNLLAIGEFGEKYLRETYTALDRYHWRAGLEAILDRLPLDKRFEVEGQLVSAFKIGGEKQKSSPIRLENVAW